MSDWGNFFFAQVGASAALAGLLFVGVSINLARILQYPTLPDRALEALVVLVQVLTVSSLALVPRQSLAAFGIELLLAGAISWPTVLFLTVRTYRAAERQYRTGQMIHFVLGQAATFPFLVAGALFLTNNLAGLYWMVPGTLFSYLVAVFNAWVLLIEIHR